MAADLPNPVPEEVKQQRYERFMAVQQQISEQKLQEKVGKTLMVLVDEIDEEEGIAICRSYADAPEIDGHVYVDDIVRNGQVALKVGDMLTVTIDEASGVWHCRSYAG